MSLQLKTLIGLVLFISIAMVMLLIGVRQILQDDYTLLERQEAEENLRRVENALADDLSVMSFALGDWAYWTDTAEFVSGEYEGSYSLENITLSTFLSLRIDAMLLLDRDGNFVLARGYDSEQNSMTPLPQSLEDYLRAHPEILVGSDPRRRRETYAGIIRTRDGIYLLSCRAILTSRQRGPSAGSIIWMRKLTPERIADLAQRTQFDLELYDLSHNLPPSIALDIEALSAAQPTYIDILSADRIEGYLLLQNPEGQAVAALRLVDDRALYQRGENSINDFSRYYFVTLALLALGVVIGLNGMVLGRLKRLSTELQNIGLAKGGTQGGKQEGKLRRVTDRGYDEIGRLAGTINQAFTALETSQRALRTSQQRLQSVVRHAPVILFAADDKDRIILIEGKGVEALGINPARLLGRYVTDVSRRMHYSTAGYRRAKTGQEVHDTVEILGRKVELILVPMMEAGRLLGVTGVAIDVTAHLAAEDALREAKESAEKANAVKSSFLAHMSHELRTPLNAIINFTQFLSNGMLGSVNDEQKEYLEKVLDSSQHLLNLINDVLDLSKIEAGAFKYNMEANIEVKELLRPVISTAQAHLIGRPVVALRLDIPNVLPRLTLDKRRIQQVMLNLVSNACKFTDEGHIRIFAKATEDGVLMGVEDTGPGIPPQEQDLIFESFHQSDIGMKAGGGTGLGLPISRRLVEAHGGSLWIESQTGQGSTFFVQLPLIPAAVEVTQEEEPRQNDP